MGSLDLEYHQALNQKLHLLLSVSAALNGEMSELFHLRNQIEAACLGQGSLVGHTGSCPLTAFLGSGQAGSQHNGHLSSGASLGGA